MRYFLASSVVGVLLFLAALTEYAKARIKRRFRHKPTTHILPTLTLPSLSSSDEATVSTHSSASLEASRQEGDPPTVLLACVRPSMDSLQDDLLADAWRRLEIRGNNFTREQVIACLALQSFYQDEYDRQQIP